MNFFSLLFGVFIKSRHTGHLFQRRAIFESLSAASSAGAFPDQLSRRLVRDADDELSSVLTRLDSSKDGLTDAEADAIREKVGLNEVEHEKPLPGWLHLWLSYKNPFNLLLTALAVVSWLTDDLKAAIVIGSMVVISTLMRFVQERRSNQAAQNLKELVSNKATVIRRDSVKPASPVEIPIKQLVPGDVRQGPVRQPVSHDRGIAAG